MSKSKSGKDESGRQESGVNLATQSPCGDAPLHLPHGGTDMVTKCPSVYIKTFGWPLVTVARDGVGDSKEDKRFGVKRLRQGEP